MKRLVALGLVSIGCSSPGASSVLLVPLPSPLVEGPPATVDAGLVPADGGDQDSAFEDAAVDASGPRWSDEAGWIQPTYDRGAEQSFLGASGEQDIACDGADSLVLSACGCDVHGGVVTSAGPSDAGAWACVATPDSPAKGATIIAWARCRRW